MIAVSDRRWSCGQLPRTKETLVSDDAHVASLFCSYSDSTITETLVHPLPAELLVVLESIGIPVE